ncbi:hypothetical protein [Actinoplanes sp. G11-F43]|uniref:hypothetical protein n=1 Tax=Actinoplanes sp. G11-F43 TaxID=3424130 RepID=UPI003D34AF93
MDIRRTGLEMIRGDFLPRDQFRSQVWRRWTVETDPGIRLDLIACFGELLDHDSDDTATHTELHRLLDDPPDGPDPDPREGLAALHALAGTDPGLPLTRIPQMIAAIRDPRVSRWRDTARFAGAPQAIVAATARLLAADPVAHTTFTLAVGEDSGGEERVAVLGQVGRLLATWRHLDPLLIDFLIDRLGDSGAEVRYRAAQLLGCVPALAAADALAVLAADTTVRDSRTGITVGDAAVWALSRLHDPRCVPWLQRRMPYPAHQTMTSSEVGPAFDLPSLEEVLAPLARFAADLTGAVSRLPDKPVMCAILGAWAVPDGIAHLTPLLTAPSPGLPPADPVLAGAAARALGEIGPAAARAAGLLRDHPWAYWRVTGDPAPLLVALPPSWDRQALRDLADLGPLARQAEARIRSLTTPKKRRWGTRRRRLGPPSRHR